MKSKLKWYDYFAINVNWFAISVRSQMLTALIIPLLVQQFIGEDLKGTYLGIIRLWSLMAALLVQALAGNLSDQSSFRWGKRRPFILAGSTFEIVILILIGFAAGLSGATGYWVLFALVILSMIGSNTLQAGTQGLIPDLVPDEKKGLASGVKALFELPLSGVFVTFVLARMVAGGHLWRGLVTLIIVIGISIGISMFSPEQAPKDPKTTLDWSPFLRLLAMTAAFTALILGGGWGVNQILAAISGDFSNQIKISIGVAGVISMGVIAVIGVWLSVRISLGEEIKKYRSFTWWVVNRLVFLIGAANLGGFMVFFLQEKFPDFQGELAVEPASKIIMVVGVFILITALPGGYLADRWGKKTLVAASGVLAGLGTAVVVLASSLTTIIIGGSIIGGGVGLFYPANWALGTDIVPKDRSGQFLGLSNLAGAGAGAIGAYLGGPIADQMGYHVIMAIYGALAFLSIFALLGIRSKG